MMQPESNYARLNARLYRVQGALLIIFPVLLVLQPVIFGSNPYVLAVHALCYAMAALVVCAIGPNDAALAFIVIHPFWFFSFALYFYAFCHGKSAEVDLYAPLLSAGLELAALVASLAGYGLVLGFARLGALPAQRPALGQNALRRFAIALMVFAAPFSLVSLLDPANHFLNAVTGLANPLVYLSLICLSVANTSNWYKSKLLWAAVCAQFIYAIIVNSRGFYLSIGLTVAVIYLAQEQRIISLARLVSGYILVRTLNALSTIMLAGRLQVGHQDSAPLVVQALASPDFYWAVLGFDTLRDARLIVDSDFMRHDRYRLDMFEGRQGIGERLTELPFMDIVVAYLPRKMPVDWYEIGNSFLSVMPSLGQSKDPDLFDDRLSWQTGLMDPATVGHPLVTVIGEFYAMGGVSVLMALFCLTMALICYFYFVSQRLFGERYIAAATLIVSAIYLVFSSTATSALSVPLRIYPVVILAYVVFVRVAGLVGGSQRNS